jgi:hypothetical protein
MRNLTEEEINILDDNGCWAEDWGSIMVSDDFKPKFMHRVRLYGEVSIGDFEKNVEVSPGFLKHSGINDATLRNVSVGDNCLIENIGNFINNYTIGDDCYISNISTMETTEGATYGQGNIISVLNEVGDGNVILFNGLNSQLAALMVSHSRDKELVATLRRLIREEIEATSPDRGTIGNGVKIVNTKEITNTIIGDDSEICGAARLSDATIVSSPQATVYIGTGVICENSIISHGSSIINSVKMQDCFVGEACKISNGFTASQSVFFANCFMSNGEACAAFCGPFTASHHKSSLLIGAQFSFYNAGSATNFSNHAYKMGPLHWGILERGSKTASGAYILMPAEIGAFSVCFGKVMHHPDTRPLPFSYIIAGDSATYISPGRNITTVGLYRDIRKWPKRDMRPSGARLSTVNFNWLSPFTVGEIVQGKQTLETLRRAAGDDVAVYPFHGALIKASSLAKGLRNYDMALRMYMGSVVANRKQEDEQLAAPADSTGLGEWDDLAGLLLPVSEEERLVSDVKEGVLDSIQAVIDKLADINVHYSDWQWAWAYQLIQDYYGIEEITPDDAEKIAADADEALHSWIAEIRKDAEKEFALGDVEQSVLDNFLASLDKETEEQD